jgi:hypothetical protein
MTQLAPKVNSHFIFGRNLLGVQNMNNWVNHRWYEIIELGLVFTCGMMMMILPGANGWLFLVSLLPALARLLAGVFPYKTTLFDLPMVVFLITACMGVWVSYDRNAAWAKFWLLAEAVLLFYILSRQPPQNWKLITGILCVLDILLVSWFLLTYDWRSSPTEFALINHVGLWWEGIRPEILSRSLLTDRAGDLIATFLPFTLLCSLWYLRTRRWSGLLFTAVAGGFVMFGFLLASSLASWLALAGALGLWLLWRLSGFFANRLSKKMFIIYGLVLLLMATVLIGIGLNFFGKKIAFPNLQSGSNITIGRMQLASDTIRLVSDYPFTGGGLAAFSGQYSYYILNIPYFFFNHSHNILLDVAFEQSPVGMLAFLALLGGSFWLLLTNHQKSLLTGALFISLLVVVIQGLADDPLYGGAGTPLLFVFPGLIVALSSHSETRSQNTRSVSITTRSNLLWISSYGLVATALLIYLFRSLLIAQWYANMGAIDMARVELAGFPNGKWNEAQNIPKLAIAEDLFHKSLSLDEDNFTAQYRLGLVYMYARNFYPAKNHLEKAFATQHGHRGVRKDLGYCYVWMDNFEKALPLLSCIPEARNELDFYAWWWRTQGRDDLATRAEFMLKELNNLLATGAP